MKYLTNSYKENIIFSQEDEPLGTGGAIKNAEKLIKSDNVIIMNGDTYLNLDFLDLLKYHCEKNSLITIAGVESKLKSDVGSISVDKDFKIVKFREKSSNKGKGYINAGVYVFKREAFNILPDKIKFSVEKDVFSSIIIPNHFLYISDSEFFDIGTPEKLMLFEKYMKSMYE